MVFWQHVLGLPLLLGEYKAVLAIVARWAAMPWGAWQPPAALAGALGLGVVAVPPEAWLLLAFNIVANATATSALLALVSFTNSLVASLDQYCCLDETLQPASPACQAPNGARACSMECASQLAPLYAGGCRPLLNMMFDAADGEEDGNAHILDAGYRTCMRTITVPEAIDYIAEKRNQGQCTDADLDAGANMWSHVDDFDWLKQQQSPNWSVLPEGERAPPTKLAEHLPAAAAAEALVATGEPGEATVA